MNFFCQAVFAVCVTTRCLIKEKILMPFWMMRMNPHWTCAQMGEMNISLVMILCLILALVSATHNFTFFSLYTLLYDMTVW